MSNFGFIITRHVNSEKTNEYWNQCVKLIRTVYPLRKIVIIDDNSNPVFLKADHDYENLTIVQSEHPGRGELLPYVYYVKYKWFPNAVIIHDSLFIHKRIPFENFKMPVITFWHEKYDKENLPNINRLASVLTNNRHLIRKLNEPEDIINTFEITKDKSFNLSFGAQAYIKLSFLEHLENKYHISNLLSVVNTKADRCALERIMGLLFCEEHAGKMDSLFGRIHSHYRSFNYKFDDYKNDFNNKKVPHSFVKVWSGR